MPVYAQNKLPTSLAGEDETMRAGEEKVAAQAIVDLVRANRDEGKQLEICAIGPLTNIAAALALDATIGPSIKCLTIMGGHMGHGGVRFAGRVLPMDLDFNLVSNANASHAVFRPTTGIPCIRLVTADVTLRCWMGRADLARLEKSGHAFVQRMCAHIRRWTPMQETFFQYSTADIDNVAFLHDPLTLACVLDESFCTFADVHIEGLVTTDRREGFGWAGEGKLFRTISRPHEVPGATRIMRCATDVDPDKVRQHVVDRLVDHFGV